MTLFDGLNEHQITAVTTTEGAVRLAAGPGTGKTRTLTTRFCYLVSVLGINPANILCATFTNRAADQMKRRIRELVGDVDVGYISTIHSFCLQLLKEDIHVLGYPKNFCIIDVEDQKTLLHKIFEDMKISMADYTIKRAVDEVLEARKLGPDNYMQSIFLLNNEELREQFQKTPSREDGIFLRYLYEQKKNFGVDFNDLINFASYILDNYQDIRAKWQMRMQYVMIDEFQDVSARQYKLAVSLAGLHKNLFIVGDPDQTIYSWRGSHTSLFNNFTEVHQGTSLELPLNYRSTPEIIKAADAVISKNPDRLPYKQTSACSSGPLPLFFRGKTDKEEAKWIGDKITELLAEGQKLKEIGVIYRAHHLSRDIEESLIEKKLPYQLFSGVEFYKRAEIKDMLAWLRMLSSADDPSFLRTIRLPRRKIGKKRLQFLSDFADAERLTLYQALKQCHSRHIFFATGASDYVRTIEYVRGLTENLSLGDLFQRLMDMSGYEAYLRHQGDQNRLDNASEFKRSLLTFAEDEEATLQDFLDRAALFANIDRNDRTDSVKLMSIHSSKGLEFEVVFLSGLSEGALPSRKALTSDDLAEERRLCYVAMTRAKNRLFMTDSAGKDIHGDYKRTSRFVGEAGANNVKLTGHLEPFSRAAATPSRQSSVEASFQLGQKVFHAFFGAGAIIDVNSEKAAYTIKFDNVASPRTLSFNAPLSPLVEDEIVPKDL
ncbi:MAG: ATP-dependent helicase [Deltaproteobacteria bacterium]|jgi:DNA helicase-2/ATP-dependent DNA helicase PcrA|nr:ATP-dependent helicase [Deltaproteobacteria bacterium]